MTERIDYLREVFDVDYGEVAETIGKTEVACRQIVRRERPLRAVLSETHQKLMRRFAEALTQDDFAG